MTEIRYKKQATRTRRELAAYLRKLADDLARHRKPIESFTVTEHGEMIDVTEEKAMALMVSGDSVKRLEISIDFEKLQPSRLHLDQRVVKT